MKDAITAGLQSLTAGKKNPLSEYNEAFCLLQRRRKIIPVSVQAKANPVSHVWHDDSEAIEVETQTDIIGIPIIPTHGLQEYGLESQDNPFIDSLKEDDIMQELEEEVITKVARIIEDLENGVIDPTLASLGAEDIVLDMDDIFVYQDDDWSDSSSEGTVDGG